MGTICYAELDLYRCIVTKLTIKSMIWTLPGFLNVFECLWRNVSDMRLIYDKYILANIWYMLGYISWTMCSW